MDGIVFDEMRHGADIRDIVHGDDLDLVLEHQLSQHQSPDAAEPIDGELHD